MADNAQPDSDASVWANGRCPICKSETALRWRPFCSRRCADLDLSRWLKGSYAVPVVDADDDEDGDDPTADMPLPYRD